MRKKIMLIVPMLHQGGFERICIMTARLLQKEHDVTVVVFSLKDLAFDIEGLHVIDLDLEAQSGKLGKILNVFKRGRRLTKLQKQLKTEVSYSFGMTANIANAMSHGAKKKITACHSFEEIKKTGYMKLISRHSDVVLCCAKKMADLVQKTYGFGNIVPLWNPCDTEGILAQSVACQGEDLAFFETEDKVLVSMGREDDVKGFWHLLKVFRKVWEERKDVRLAIIGDGDFTEYKQLAESLEIQEKVCFTGLKRNPFPYLTKSDLYLLTSLSEGLPNALVEAMALSVPIVSVNCLSGPAEILHEDWKRAEEQQNVFEGDYGILTPVFSPEKNMNASLADGKVGLEQSEERMAKAVLALLENKELYERYKDKGLKRAMDFSKESYKEQLLKIMGIQ